MAAAAAAAAARRFGTLARRPSALYAGSTSGHLQLQFGRQTGCRWLCDYSDPHVAKASSLAKEILKMADSPEVTFEKMKPLIEELAKTARPQEVSVAKVSDLAEKITKIMQESPAKSCIEMALPLIKELVESMKLSNVEVDVTHARILAEHISKIASESSIEAAIVAIRPLVQELMQVVKVSRVEGLSLLTRKDLESHGLEGRLCMLEAATNYSSKMNFLLHSVFVCTLMAIPSGIYMVKLDGDRVQERVNQKLEAHGSRISALENSDSHITPTPATTPGAKPEATNKEAITKAEAHTVETQELHVGWMAWIRSIIGLQ